MGAGGGLKKVHRHTKTHFGTKLWFYKQSGLKIKICEIEGPLYNIYLLLIG